MIKKIVAYGVALAALTVLLNAFHYHYMVRNFTIELYIGLIALIFAGMGIWAGKKLTLRNRKSNSEFQPNRKAIEYLGISERELEVLKLVAAGHSNRDIAEQLYISTNTVKSHISNLFSKLGARRRTLAVKKARSLKILP